MHLRRTNNTLESGAKPNV